MLPNQLRVILTVQEKWKLDFQNSGHLGFLIWTILAIFDLHDTSYQVSSTLAFQFKRISEKKIFKMAAICIIDWNYFGYFWSTIHPDASNQISSQLVFRFRRSEKQIFKMAAMEAISDFWSEEF